MKLENYLLGITTLCLICEIGATMAKKTNEIYPSETSCVGCNEDFLDVRSQYHLQMIKERIQFVLGLDPSKPAEIPQRSVSALPGPIKQGDFRVIGQSNDQHNLNTNVQRQIILSEQDGMPGRSKKRYLQFNISLTSFGSSRELGVADIWLTQALLRKSHRIKMTLISKGLTSKRQTRMLKKQDFKILRKNDDWASLSIKNHLGDFMDDKATANFDQRTIVLLLRLSSNKIVEQTSHESERFRSFLVIETTEKAKSRQRRGVDCIAGQNNRCCRAKLTVKFADIGLGNHVIEPREFEAYQCVGTCGSFSKNVSPRVEIVKSVLSNLRQKNEKTDHIKFCCTAERSVSQKLIYYSNDKTQIFAKNVEGLIVESCDCL